MLQTKVQLVVVMCVLIQICAAVPKMFDDTKSTYPENQWRRSYKEHNDSVAAADNANDRTQRLGFTTGYGSGINGYPHSAPGIYGSPLKLDLGGIVLGTLVGIGALLILPKLVNVFSGGYGGGGYGRSADNDVTGITEMLAKIDDYLGKHNIDSAACMQKTVCNYIRSSEYHVNVGTADQVDQIIHAVSSNSLLEYMLDGTAIKEAIENGKNHGTADCDKIYPACPLDKQSAMQLLTKVSTNTNNNNSNLINRREK